MTFTETGPTCQGQQAFVDSLNKLIKRLDMTWIEVICGEENKLPVFKLESEFEGLGILYAAITPKQIFGSWKWHVITVDPNGNSVDAGMYESDEEILYVIARLLSMYIVRALLKEN